MAKLARSWLICHILFKILWYLTVFVDMIATTFNGCYNVSLAKVIFDIGSSSNKLRKKGLAERLG